MTNATRTYSSLEEYVITLCAPEDEALKWIQAEAQKNDLPAISIRPFEGRLLQFLMKAVNAQKAVEIGALAGYSGVWIARALPADGKLYTLEVSSKHAKVARASYAKAGVADKVELLEGAATDLLPKLKSKGPFDFVFIDADKGGYPAYLEWAVENLRPGGMVTAHNAFRGGRVLTPESDDDRAMGDFNRTLVAHPRLESMILGIGDGLAAGIKKA